MEDARPVRVGPKRWGGLLLLFGLIGATVGLASLAAVAWGCAQSIRVVQVGRYGVVGPKTRMRIHMYSSTLQLRTRRLYHVHLYGDSTRRLGVEIASFGDFHLVDFDLR